MFTLAMIRFHHQLAAASLPPDIGRDRPILRVLAARHALGLAADVRRVLLVAADGAVNRRRIHEVSGEMECSREMGRVWR